MASFTDPFQRRSTPTEAPPSPIRYSPWRTETHSSGYTSGYIVDPGRIVSKDERLRRKNQRVDSAFEILDGQRDEKFQYSWSALGLKVATDPVISSALSSLDHNLDKHFDQGTGNLFRRDCGAHGRAYNLRSLILLTIALLIVFGSLYILVEYLLFATRTSAACFASTVYIPITYTITTSVASASSPAALSAAASTAQITHTYTITSTSTSTETATSYVTLQTPTTLTSTVVAGPSYLYTVNSIGSTIWVSGMSPPPGAPLTTLTTSIFVTPVVSASGVPTSSALPVETTGTEPQTLTPPAYTSTLYSYAGPDLTSTSTSTSTHYLTYTVSQANASVPITTTRASFSGIGNSGWNTTSGMKPMTIADATQTGVTTTPIATTLTGIYYLGSGNQTTSTSTTLITTTVALAYTTTIVQTTSSAFGTGYVTIITALPVTITPGYATPAFSTSLSLTPASTGTTASNASMTGPQMTTNSSSPTADTIVSSATSFPSIISPSQGTSMNLNTTGTTAIWGSASTSAVSLSILTTLSSLGSYSRSSHTPIPPTSQILSNATGATGLTSTGTSTMSFSGADSSSLAGPMPWSNNSATTYSTPSTTSVSLLTAQTAVTTNPYSNPTLSALWDLTRTYPSSSSMSGSSSSIASAVDTATLPTSPTYASKTSITSSLTAATGRTASSRGSLPTTDTFVLATVSSSIATAPGLPSISTLSTIASSARSSDSAVVPTMTSTLSGMYTFTTTGTGMTASGTKSTSSFSNPFPASSATVTPTAGCGEHGAFMVDFDDLPRFLPTNQNNSDITQAPPIESPYHHLTFNGGYVYAPQPKVPYAPISPPHLAVFLANGSDMTASSFGNLVKPGEIGDGPRDPLSAYWFDADSAFFGCDNAGPDPCTLVFSAYTWSKAANTEVKTYSQNATLTPCPGFNNCRLQRISFPQAFRSLTGLQIQAYVDNEPKMFFMDDLALAWTNNTCAAGLQRQSSQ